MSILEKALRERNYELAALTIVYGMLQVIDAFNQFRHDAAVEYDKGEVKKGWLSVNGKAFSCFILSVVWFISTDIRFQTYRVRRVKFNGMYAWTENLK